jgi:hypothetical protein
MWPEGGVGTHLETGRTPWVSEKSLNRITMLNLLQFESKKMRSYHLIIAVE